MPLRRTPADVEVLLSRPGMDRPVKPGDDD
jgi:hypothetical protein